MGTPVLIYSLSVEKQYPREPGFYQVPFGTSISPPAWYDTTIFSLPTFTKKRQIKSILPESKDEKKSSEKTILVKVVNQLLKQAQKTKDEQIILRMVSVLSQSPLSNSEITSVVIHLIWVYARESLTLQCSKDIIYTCCDLRTSEKDMCESTKAHAKFLSSKIRPDDKRFQDHKCFLSCLFMGIIDPYNILNLSRSKIIPENIHESRAYYSLGWNHPKEISRMHPNSLQHEYRPTLNRSTLELAGENIEQFLRKCQISEFSFLEIFAGNCEASKIIFKKLKELEGVGKKLLWLATDIYDYPKKIEREIKFCQSNAVDSVGRFGSASNVLIAISPQPFPSYSQGCFCDYFAITDFIEMKRELATPSYVIIVGELGASDGSEGTYLAFTTHPLLRLVMKVVLMEQYRIGGMIYKELFIFEVMHTTYF